MRHLLIDDRDVVADGFQNFERGRAVGRGVCAEAEAPRQCGDVCAVRRFVLDDEKAKRVAFTIDTGLRATSIRAWVHQEVVRVQRSSQMRTRA